MAINLNSIGSQRSEVIPPGVYKLRARLMAGGAGFDGMLTRAKNGRSLMLKLECYVVDGEHKDHRIYDYVTVELDESTNSSLPPIKLDALEKLRISLRLGLIRARAIVDSAFGLDPHDRSPEMEKIRTFDDYSFFDNLTFYAQVDERPGDGKYEPSNTIDFVIVPGDPAYPKKSQDVAPPGHYRDPDLDDEIPY
jgi:hypothetical protein